MSAIRRQRHGLEGAKSSYYAMRSRCLRPNNAKYHRYGGRGITIHPDWLGEGGFVRFFAFMGLRPKGMTLDRIKNDGNYEPGNLRWADKRTQALNVGPEEFARRQSMLGSWRRKRSHRLGLTALVRCGRLLGFSETEKLMRDIREELEERFGPPAPMSAPRQMLCVEEAFIAGDFTRKSLYWEGLENLQPEWSGHGTWEHIQKHEAA